MDSVNFSPLTGTDTVRLTSLTFKRRKQMATHKVDYINEESFKALEGVENDIRKFEGYYVIYQITRNGKTMDYIRENFISDSLDELRRVAQQTCDIMRNSRNLNLTYYID